MKTLKVDILNPKARQLMKDLADLDLIAIRGEAQGDFFKIVENIRLHSGEVPGPAEIGREVENVRSERQNS